MESVTRRSFFGKSEAVESFWVKFDKADVVVLTCKHLSNIQRPAHNPSRPFRGFPPQS